MTYDMLIVLARDEQFLFLIENDPKGEPLHNFFLFSLWMKAYNFAYFFYLFSAFLSPHPPTNHPTRKVLPSLAECCRSAKLLDPATAK